MRDCMNHQLRSLILLFIMLFSIDGISNGQAVNAILAVKPDTLHLTLQDAEKMMLEKNLDLIANHYNIDIAHAQTISAKLWDNPGLSYSQNILNPTTKIPFTIRNGG